MMSSAPPLVPGSAQRELSSVDDIILQDHAHIKSCYEHYLSEGNLKEKEKYANELIRALSVHSICEELIVYPYFEK
jgi:hypothetical protein